MRVYDTLCVHANNRQCNAISKPTKAVSSHLPRAPQHRPSPSRYSLPCSHASHLTSHTPRLPGAGQVIPWPTPRSPTCPYALLLLAASPKRCCASRRPSRSAPVIRLRRPFASCACPCHPWLSLTRPSGRHFPSSLPRRRLSRYWFSPAWRTASSGTASRAGRRAR